MKTDFMVADAYWTARLAPYVFAVAALGFGSSLIWSQPPLLIFAVAILSGLLVALFHIQRWRTKRELFQLAAMASYLIPMLQIIHKPFPTDWQCLAAFAISYSATVFLFRRSDRTRITHIR